MERNTTNTFSNEMMRVNKPVKENPGGEFSVVVRLVVGQTIPQMGPHLVAKLCALFLRSGLAVVLSEVSVVRGHLDETMELRLFRAIR